MNATIELIFDFVSPNAYFAYYPLKDMAAKYGSELLVTPVFLGGMHKLTGNAPPFIRDAEVKGKNEYAMLEMNRFIAKHGMTNWKMNPKFPFNSVTLQRLLCGVDAAERLKLLDLLLPAIWEHGLDASDPDAIGQALSSARLDAADLLSKTQEPTVKQSLMDNTDQAVARGAFGIPTIYVKTGDKSEMFFGKERLGQIEELLQSL
ncbi:2-hydroxychromene-2-carboxylate isomerase [Altererythrobacter gangjinensis]|uniref:2-hydroxychromene-2-carboxylate isomerase n=1 Tax=Pontixanthobacter gangjinensis TaxID=1028742 RepID=A0A6I4SLQ1_9SPHN|nr:2-hydroxychromene-2-carboxylate isomerase [Pontixanthobacter gangjinensis]